MLRLAALKGVFTDIVTEQVTYVNAPLLAAERGTEVRLVTEVDSTDYRNLITLRGTLGDGTMVSVSGTLAGVRQVERVVEVNGYAVDIDLAAHMLFLIFVDRPGVVASLGKVLGEHGTNIAGMQVSRTRQGGQAFAILTLDSAVPNDVIELLGKEIDAEKVTIADLDD